MALSNPKLPYSKLEHSTADWKSNLRRESDRRPPESFIYSALSLFQNNIFIWSSEQNRLRLQKPVAAGAAPKRHRNAQWSARCPLLEISQKYFHVIADELLRYFWFMPHKLNKYVILTTKQTNKHTHTHTHTYLCWILTKMDSNQRHS